MRQSYIDIAILCNLIAQLSALAALTPLRRLVGDILGRRDDPPSRPLFERALTKNENPRQSDPPRLMVVHGVRVSNHSGPNMWAICEDGAIVQRRQDHGVEHNPFVGQNGTGSRSPALGNE